MKRRVLSGLLAAVLLFTTAFAAGADPAPEEEAPPITLTFAVTLPDGVQAVDDALASQLEAVLVQRVTQLGLDGAAVSLADDRTSLTVTLPADADAPDGLAAFLALPNALRIADAEGGIALTGADVTAAEAGQAAEGDDGAAYLQLTLSDEAQDALSVLDEEDALAVTLDGEAVGETAAYAADDGLLTVTGGLDLDAAKLLAARIMAGELPVALTLTDASGQPAVPEEPAEPSFPDIAGHWAAAELERAVELGLLNGVDGKMLPDNPVKRSEAIVILNRTLGASVQDDTAGLKNVPQNAWYAADLGKAIHLGLIGADDSRNFDAAATRAEAFVLLARAFAYDRAEAASDVLDAFTDTASMTVEQKQAAAALVAAGVVNGDTETTLAPSGALTRAQFVTMLLRIVPHFPTEDADLSALTGGALLTGSTVELSGSAPAGDRVFACGTEEVTLSGVTADGRVVLKGAEAVKLTASKDTALSVLAVDPAGTAEVTLRDDSHADTLVIAGTGGAVACQGETTNIEITASNRTIDLSGMQADTLTVTGSGNTIVVDGAVRAVSVNAGAARNTLTLNKKVETLLVAGVGTKVDGKGKAESVDIRAVDCEVSLSADSKIENIDPGLSGVTIEMDVPASVKAGGSLLTKVSFTGVSEEKLCSAQWYQNGQPLEAYRNSRFALTADKTSSHTTYFTFTKDMETSVTIGFRLTYDNPSTGETEELYAEKTVPIENYSDEWYYQRDVNRVLNLVSSTYRGNYTTAYAVNNDYETYEKEVWVNAKGYSSNTKYLLWINRAYQHVNVFEGSKGNWKLIKSFLVGTGAASSPTPTGLTTVSYKSAGGWTTSTYTVRPVVGFYPGTGYAFHSRLCYPGTDTEYDYSAGYPISHGCVRMYKSDIWWIYNNIPVGTTVAIF
ncbi:hypothetical protein AGATL06_11740 [Agathobaculum sp. TL06]